MIYIIHGNYYYFQEKKLAEIKQKWMENNPSGKVETVFCSDVNSVNDLHLDVSDLFATPSLSVLKDFSKLPASISKKLTGWLENMDAGQDIVLVANSTLKKEIETLPNPKIFHFERPRYESQESLSAIKYVYDYLKKNKIKFDPSLPKEIVNFVGVDMFTLENELAKLESLGITELNFEIVTKYLVANKTSIIFNLVNLIFADVGNYDSFLTELNFQFEDPTVFILISSLLARELRIKYLNSSDLFLKKLYNELLEIDIEFKRGGDPKNLILKFYFLVHEESFKNFEQK